MEVQCDIERLPSDIRRFTVRRIGSPIDTVDYVVGTACCLYILISIACRQSIILTDPFLIICICLMTWRITSLMKTVCEETLLVVQELGVQITRKSFSGKESHVFIDKDKISSIVINEGITMFRVIYYMAFIVNGQSDMVLAFNLLPRMGVLLPIYVGTRAAFYGEPET
uniref:Phosphatidylinositol N-acetylglucosaminyltransferase subunit H conserved domain-containing protein n=1 Tax=Spongospora subterranea TaxID=70186 RepID=A0A0H5RAZ1_9EUKA|eukprot:CRZ10777.1 hypothetical protein [Spongospora subterranea]